MKRKQSHMKEYISYNVHYSIAYKSRGLNCLPENKSQSFLEKWKRSGGEVIQSLQNLIIL